MAGEIRVNTDQVAQIASTIEDLNNQLDEILRESQQTVRELSGTWDGEASQETIAAFDTFASKYFDEYFDIIQQYVQFLRVNVESGYFETETANTQLAEDCF